jgi:hypothetical protein
MAAEQPGEQFVIRNASLQELHSGRHIILEAAG